MRQVAALLRLYIERPQGQASIGLLWEHDDKQVGVLHYGRDHKVLTGFWHEQRLNPRKRPLEGLLGVLVCQVEYEVIRLGHLQAIGTKYVVVFGI